MAGTFVDGDPSTPPAPRPQPRPRERQPTSTEPRPAGPATTTPPGTPPGTPGAGRPARPPGPKPAPPGAPLGNPSPPPPERQKRYRKLFRDPAADTPFLDRLRAFRGNENPHPPDGFSGGEGQLFHSDLEPGRVLKRWYTDRVADKKDSPGKPTSVQLLRDAAKLIDGKPELAKHLEVVRVHDEGPDWIIRDFDYSSLRITDLDLANKQAADAAIKASLSLLRAMRNQQPQNKALGKLLSRLSTIPPSANVHWSKDRGKLLIIDLM